MTDRSTLSLQGWLDLVVDYWVENGKLCDHCEFNESDSGCEFLYAPEIPIGECPGVDVRQPEDK